MGEPITIRDDKGRHQVFTLTMPTGDLPLGTRGTLADPYLLTALFRPLPGQGVPAGFVEIEQQHISATGEFITREDW